jgi:hypothetical protein
MVYHCKKMRPRFEVLRIVLPLVAALPAMGQVLQVSSGAGAPGELISIGISLDTPAAALPATLKWDTIFPAQLVSIEGEPEIGGRPKKSGKSLTCKAREAYSYVCILAGGQNPIENGPIAIFHFRIHSDASPATSAVRAERVEAITKDLKILKLRTTAGRLELR